MELTQYIKQLRWDADLVTTQPRQIARLARQLLEFHPEMVPKSAVVQRVVTDRTFSIRSAFIEIYEKYIDKRADWKIRLQPGTTDKVLQLYRTLKSRRAKRFSEIIIPTTINGGIENTELPTNIPMSSNGKAREHLMTKTVHPQLVEAVTLLMTDAVRQLDAAFDTYRETEVMFTLFVRQRGSYAYYFWRNVMAFNLSWNKFCKSF